MTDIQHYNPELVVMKNPIINTKLDFTPLQMQIFLEMVARIHPKDTDFNVLRLDVKEFAEKIGMDNTQIYDNIRVASRGMMKTIITINEQDGSDFTDLTLLTKSKYWSKKGYVELRFHEDLRPYLLQIKESQFISYHIEATRSLNNYAFIKLYWLLVAWKSVKTKTFLLDKLKETMELEGQYKQFPDFRKRVLLPARAAFIKYGEIYFDFEEIRFTKSQKSPVEKIKFTILPNPNWKKRKSLNFVDVEPVQPDMTDTKLQEVLKGILSLSKSISEAQAMQFIRNHTSYNPTDILSEIIAMKKNKANGAEYSNPLAALSKAVANNYSKGLYEEQERKRQEQEEQNMINAWRSEFEERFNEFKHTIASEATPQEVELYREAYPTGFNMKGEPFKNRLGNFVAISRGFVPQDEELNFTNWVRKHKGETLQKLDNRWKIVKTLF
jgi:plasmid replication initiation protein